MLKFDENLAYILGVYLGDGNINIWPRKQWGGVQVLFRLQVKDKDFADEVERRLKLIVPNKVWRKEYDRMCEGFKKSTHMHLLHCCSRELVFWLRDTTDSKKKVPSFLFKTTIEEKKAFLAGFLDSEGWVQKQVRQSGTSIVVGFCSTSDWIDSIARLFQTIGVPHGKKQLSHGPSDGVIKSKKNLYRFYLKTKPFLERGCYFTIARKQERLRDYNVMAEKIEEREKKFVEYKKKYSTGSLSYRKIEKEFGISRETARYWDKKIENKEPLFLKYRLKG